MKKKIGTTVSAHGKINLYLDVTSKDENGYHKIESIMQSVSLCDRVSVSVVSAQSRGIAIDCNLRYIPRDSRNIAYKAAELFMQEANIVAGVKITLAKRIPVAGGMAGGSADAAAVLGAMNRLFGGVLPHSSLFSLAEKIGSDVPFCLKGGTAICRGYGEIIEDIPVGTRLKLLIVGSNESVSTPWAYGALDAEYGNFSDTVTDSARLTRLTEALAGGDVAAIARNMYDIFEKVVLPERPSAARAKEILLENGAVGAMMSGSGPTVFGIFADDGARLAASAALTAQGYYPKSAETL